jgi:hypothetical protein
MQCDGEIEMDGYGKISSENLHRQLVELDEIADGAYSDGPLARGNAKRKAAEIRAELQKRGEAA